MSLQDNIHQLTSEHMTMTDDGSFNKTPPLLAELRAACGSNMGAQGGGSGGGGMIVNAKAVAIETRIREDALAEQFEMTGNEYRGNLIDLLQAWAIAASSEWQTYLEGITTAWITSIRATLIQRRPPWRPTLNCPSCGQRFHGAEREPNLWVEYWNHDEEHINPPSLWSAGCDGCGAEWSGDNLKWLRAATDTPTQDVVAQSS